MSEFSEERRKLLKEVVSGKAKKNPAIAVIASFFIPGLGQLYNGELVKGAAFVAVGVSLGILAFTMVMPAMMAPALLEFVLLLSIPYLALWAYSIYDAYTTAEKINS